MLKTPLLYLPGPTAVPDSVLRARMGPVVDDQALYGEISETVQRVLNTKSSVHILAGEGMLALDSVSCSLIEQGDNVLIISNGVFGDWFLDLVSKYTNSCTVFQCNPTSGVSALALEEFLAAHKQQGVSFKLATLVHCDTPSGVLNDIASLVPVLSRHSILSVVDVVASSFGVPIDLDSCGIDIALMGSQKALSCPSGLSMLVISERAWHAMETRRTPIPSYYCNLLLFKNAPATFPYTVSSHDLLGLREALRLLEEEGLDNVYRRHIRVAEAVRYAVQKSGLALYLASDYSPTITAFCVPQGTTSDAILQTMLNEYGIRFSSSLGSLDKKVMRIGHMGFNSNVPVVLYVLKCLTRTLRSHGICLKDDMGESFFERYYSMVELE
ncbi:Serine-pyruvate aminotransferase [Giardia lamblia P15]|uniref:alanine--glyoxylate transaminase n=1 Tax=Giardia intestinalis (strain P15) TaxID=658858 RepID=E1EXD9_GIAIA|nr:Serine-pyruvate aminotransferase [Giardia lamblia P15]